MAFGKYAVDYEQRVNYDRLRKERVQRAKEQMEKDGLGAILTFDTLISDISHPIMLPLLCEISSYNSLF